MVWNCVAFVALHAAWHFVICANRLSLAEFSHQSLSSQSGDDTEQLVNNNDSTEEEPKETRMSTLSHVMRLLSYCKYHSKWFFAGFIFLCVYSGGTPSRKSLIEGCTALRNDRLITNFSSSIHPVLYWASDRKYGEGRRQGRLSAVGTNDVRTHCCKVSITLSACLEDPANDAHHGF